MFKKALQKAGVLALMVSAIGAVVVPATAFAQDGYRNGYYGDRDGYSYGGDRDRDRHERHEWREQERREQEWRRNDWRANEWRANEWREHERREHRYDRDRGPGAYFYYGYQR